MTLIEKNENIAIKKFILNFEKYAVTYDPFPWDTAVNDCRLEFKNKNNLAASFVRYSKVMCEVFKRWENDFSVIDFGVFPGVIPKLFYEFFPKDKYKYYGIGLMFSPDFIEAMKKINVELLESELDPCYFCPKQVKPIPWKNADIVLFLDLIEHLSNPVYSLDAANQSLKKGGYLILTTDNFTNFDNLISMARGRTPLLHPIQTNMFYMGDWRPHFREYAKDDLVWMLNNSGFTVITHEYFDRKQAEFSVVSGKLIHNSALSHAGESKVQFCKIIKRYTYKALRSLFSTLGFLRNHQIVIARKTVEIGELKGKRPEVQYTLEGWLKVRKEYLGQV